LNTNERKKQSAKQKRARMSERMQKEKDIHEKAKEEQRHFERIEFENILTVMKSDKEYCFEDFLEMVDRIRKPFVCFIEGHEVSITQDDSAIMMERSVMKDITDSLFHGQKRFNSGSENEQVQKKQRQGNQAVHTEKGATAITALHQTAKRDERQNQLALKKTIDSVTREIKQVETVLTGLTTQKNKKPQSYWTADESTSQADLCLFLRMFSPACGLFTKRKNEQWKFVQEQLSQVISKAAVDAKEEEFSRRRAALQKQLDEAQQAAEEDGDDDEQGQDPEPASGAGDDKEDDNDSSGP